MGGFLLWLFVSLFTGTLCWVQAVIGLPCPACGSIRAAFDLLQGNLREAHINHPLIILSLLLYIYLPVRFILGKNRPISRPETTTLLAVVLVYLVVFAIRMILFFPHTEPMIPYEKTVWRQVLIVIKSFIC